MPLLTTPKGTGGPTPLALANSAPDSGCPPTRATAPRASTPETQPPRGSAPRGGLVRPFGRKWLPRGGVKADFGLGLATTRGGPVARRA